VHHPDFYVLQVLSTILGGGMSSRLFQEVREKRGLCYAIQPYLSTYAETGLLSIYSGTAADKADELLNVVIHELKDLTHNVTPEELSRAKAQLKSSLFMERESCAMQAEELGRQVLCFQKPIPTKEMVAAIEVVSAADIKRLTKEIISSLPTLAAIGNVAHMPSLAHVERLLKL
jgi:predicted Zn-dependent peptidase